MSIRRPPNIDSISLHFIVPCQIYTRADVWARNMSNHLQGREMELRKEGIIAEPERNCCAIGFSSEASDMSIYMGVSTACTFTRDLNSVGGHPLQN
jgi:hypothetical protein